MTEQQTLIQTAVHHPQPADQEFVLIVRGERVRVKYQPDWGGFTEDLFSSRPPFRTVHIEFFSDAPGPISESGYLSYFMTGTAEQFGITRSNLRGELQRLANRLADDYASKRRCIVCHCVDEGYMPESCWNNERMQYCHWVAVDLCSACSEAQR